MRPVLLETARLSLVPFSQADIDGLYQLWTEPSVRKFLWDDQLIPRETVIEVVEASNKSFADHKFGFWTLCLRGDPELIGFCGLRHFECPPWGASGVEVLYGVKPKHWSKGFATEAVTAALRYGFEKVNLDRIYAGADPPNKASFRVMERLGMKFAQRTTIQGMTSEVVADYYVLTRAEFLAR